MFVGKWNRSVILTYIGLAVSIFGIFICFNMKVNAKEQKKKRTLEFNYIH